MRYVVCIIASVLLAVLTLVGCSDPSEPKAETARDGTLTVFAAASTTRAIRQIAADYEKRTGTQVLVNLASSGTLARQIEAGARADVFVSASQKWMDYIQQRGLIRNETRIDLLANRLVLIAPAGSSLQMAPDDDVGNALGGHLAVGDPRHVPAGAYARAALVSLNWWDDLLPLTVKTASVTEALRLVETGQAAAGVVYANNVATSDTVRTVLVFDESLHKPIRYPAAVCSEASAMAVAFLAYLQTEPAREVFTRAGFAQPPPSE